MIADVVGELIRAGSSLFLGNDRRWFEVRFWQWIVLAVELVHLGQIFIRLGGLGFANVVIFVVGILFCFGDEIISLRSENLAPETNLLELTFVDQLLQREPNSAER